MECSGRPWYLQYNYLNNGRKKEKRKRKREKVDNDITSTRVSELQRVDFVSFYFLLTFILFLIYFLFLNLGLEFSMTCYYHSITQSHGTMKNDRRI